MMQAYITHLFYSSFSVKGGIDIPPWLCHQSLVCRNGLHPWELYRRGCKSHFYPFIKEKTSEHLGGIVEHNPFLGRRRTRYMV
jgi:hypothetical protein